MISSSSSAKQIIDKMCPNLNKVTHSVSFMNGEKRMWIRYNKKTIGMISYNLMSGEIGWLDIYKYQSCGIGTKYLKKAINEIKKEGIANKIWAYNHNKNHAFWNSVYDGKFKFNKCLKGYEMPLQEMPLQDYWGFIR